MSSSPWPRELRVLRSARGGKAIKGASVDLFTASLEQAEQLWQASAVVDTSTSPILLFYGLAQAGRAIVAAGAARNSRSAHGLHVDFGGGEIDFAQLKVKSRGQGLVHAVAEVLESPVLEAPVSLRQILCSVGTRLFRDAGDPNPLFVWSDWHASNAHDRVPPKLIIGYVPRRWTETNRMSSNETGIEFLEAPQDPSVEDIQSWLAAYPSLAALGPPTSVLMHPHISTHIQAGKSDDCYYVDLGWEEPLLDLHESWQWASALLDLDHSCIGKAGRGLIIPTVGGNAKAQHPLVTWWIVLFAFSILARYYPREWMRLLDVDRSPTATVVEALLDEAREAVPDILGRALRGVLGIDSRATRGYRDLSTYGPAAPDMWDAS